MGTLDPRKLIKMNINHMNNFHMKISRITKYIYIYVCMYVCSYIVSIVSVANSYAY